MLTIKDYMKIIDYKITEGSEYVWSCFGEARSLDSWDSDGTKNNITCVFSPVDQTVFEMEAWDNVNDRVYRWVNPEFLDAYKQEHVTRSVTWETAFDDINFIDIDVAEDFVEKATAIARGVEYDDRVVLQVDFEDSELLTYMKLAHDMDITFNEFVELALTEAIEKHKNALVV